MISIGPSYRSTDATILRSHLALTLALTALLVSACNRPPESTVISPGQQQTLDRAEAMQQTLQEQADQRAEQMREQGL